jgi:deoxyadenosine/deoxycytidine kinase
MYDLTFKNTGIKIDLIVYLRSSPDILHNRIKSRGCVEEQNINVEYFELLHKAHDEWLLYQKFPLPAPVLILDANQQFIDQVLLLKKYLLERMSIEDKNL